MCRFYFGLPGHNHIEHLKQYKKAADVFSAGVLIFWTLTGCQHPFGDAATQRTTNITRGSAANLGQPPHLPDARHTVSGRVPPPPEAATDSSFAWRRWVAPWERFWIQTLHTALGRRGAGSRRRGRPAARPGHRHCRAARRVECRVKEAEARHGARRRAPDFRGRPL